MQLFTRLVAVLGLAAFAFGDTTPPAPPDARNDLRNQIRVIARADDMGAAQAINEGCIEAYKNGIVRSIEVMVPGPWFLDAVRLLKENPGVDVGVHLTLTSEWDRMKWRPLTAAPSLVDPDGYFFPTTKAFTGNSPKPDEVERELRAQIETARRHLGDRVSHVSAHTGAATATPELKALTEKLAKEYKLRLGDSVKSAGTFGNPDLTSDQRERALIALLEKLQPGDHLIVGHPAYDTPETLRLGHAGYDNVAGDRSNVRRAFTSGRAKKVIDSRGIELIGYDEL